MFTGWNHERSGQFGPQIVCEVFHKRTAKTYDLSVRVGSPNHRKLFKMMGADSRTWKGEVIVRPEKVERSGVAYIAIESADSQEAPF